LNRAFDFILVLLILSSGGIDMANKDTIEKVKSLLEGHCYGPLREAAEKWLDVADEKFDVKDKADKAWDKLNDAAEKFSDASIKFNEKMSDVSDKIGDSAEKLAESELVKQLKDGICTVGDLIETFGAKDAAEKFGSELSEKIKSHAEVLKEKGEEFCDCDACVKAREILKDLGEDINAKVSDLKGDKDDQDEDGEEEADVFD
jgi:hypothetical protein